MKNETYNVSFHSIGLPVKGEPIRSLLRAYPLLVLEEDICIDERSNSTPLQQSFFRERARSHMIANEEVPVEPGQIPGKRLLFERFICGNVNREFGLASLQSSHDVLELAEHIGELGRIVVALNQFPNSRI